MRRSSRFQRPGLSGSSRSVVLLGGDGGGPSLNLDFSSGTLDPRITFTRSTIGTYYRGAFNQNLVTQSETFSGWFTDGVTPATSGESNPQNSGNAYGITESATTAVHRFGFTTISARQPSSQVTVSAYVKAGLRTLVAIGNNALANSAVTFQLTGSGSYGTLQSNVISASINFVGNGWYRCSVTLLTATTGDITPMLNVYTGTLGSPVASYAGNNTAPAVYVWGVQATEGSLLTPYIPTTTAAITHGQIASAAIDLPRFEYNPVSGAFRGLLIEGGATNVITGLAAGTGLTLTTNAITSPSGAVDANLFQKSDTTTPRYARWSTTLTAATNTAYTASMFVKRGNADITTSLEFNNFSDWGGTSWTVNFAVTSSGVSVSSQTNATGSVQPIGNGWYRVTATFTTGATAPTSNGFILTKVSGTTGDNIYLWGGQLESQGFASSYIPTVGGTVARGADLADITGSAFSSWFNQSEGTLYAEQQVYALIGNSAAAFIQQDGSNYYEIGQGVASLSADMVRFYVQLAGGNDVVLTTTLTGLSVGNTIRSAAAYRVNDVAFSGNANTVQTDNTFTIQTPVSMGLGRPRVGVSRSILLRRISYWPTRLPNDQLVSLTTIPSTALAMTAIQAGAKIDLTWTQVPGVEGAIYEVERSTDGGATWSPLTTSFGLAFNDTTALFPGTYTYRVRANVGGEITDWSSQVSETTVDVPSAPGSLTVTGATTSSISLSWTDSTGEDFYGIEVSPDGLGSWSLAGTAPANTTTFTHTPLAESVQRYYRVNGINKAGGGVYSSTVNSWTVPLAPTSLTATAVSSSQIDLAWTDVSTGNQSYKVERSTDNVNWTQIATGLAANATSYSAVGLTGSTLYYFRVRAANAARDSAASNTASATTQAVSTYNVEYLVVAGGGAGSAGGGGAGGFRTASGFSLTPGVQYTITVGAGGAGTSTFNDNRGAAGSNSVFSSITSDGGGGGGSIYGSFGGGNGGSGGGGGRGILGKGLGTSGQGNNGGDGQAASWGGAGGGGGAGAVGGNGGGNGTNAGETGGSGGNGSSSSISGSSVTYAGGGGAGANSSGTAATGGTGGGGAGTTGSSQATNGTVNRGSGGGGSGQGKGGSGGSGVVIIRMATANYSGTTTGSPTVTTSGSDTILTYNASGTYTA